MRPIKLIMSGFGPYAKTTQVDFDKIGSKGIFLITGDTGAGKTTIFDAISFALFNKTSGAEKDVSALRSDYADDDTQTYVELTFAHMGREYTVKRSPQYEVSKLRTKGTKLKPATAVLVRFPDEPVEGIRQVDKALEELLRINYDQFKQISMIAQGEFRKVLTADTKSRGEILQKIFATAGYNRMGYIIDEKYKNAYGKTENVYRSMNQYFEGLKYDDGSEFAEEIETQKKLSNTERDKFQTEKRLTILANIIEEDKVKEAAQKAVYEDKKQFSEKKAADFALAKANNELFDKVEMAKAKKDELDKKADIIVDLEERTDRSKRALYQVKPTYDAYHNELSNLKKINDDKVHAEEKSENTRIACDNAELELNNAEKKRTDAELYKNEAMKLKQEEGLYGQRDKVKQELSNAEQKLSILKTAYENSKVKKEKIEKLIEVAESRRKDLSDIPEKYQLQLNRYENTVKREEALKGIAEIDLISFKKIEEDLLKAQEIYKTKRETFDVLQDDYLIKERRLEECRAGILAQSLKVGVPCPVCGSREHPSPAILQETEINEESVKELKRKLNNAEKEKNDANESAVSIKASYEATKLTIIEKSKALDVVKSEDLDTTNEMLILESLIQTEYERVCSEKNGLKEECERLEKLKTELESLESTEKIKKTERDELSREYETLADNMQHAEREVATLHGKLQGIKPLYFDTLEQAVGKRKELEEKAVEIESIIVSKRNLFIQLKEQLSADKARAENLKTQMESAVYSTDTKKAVYDEVREREGFETEEEFKNSLSTREKIEENEAIIQKYKQDRTAAEESLMAATNLIEGKTRLDIDKVASEALDAKADEDLAYNNLNEIIVRRKSNEEIKENLQRQYNDVQALLINVERLKNLKDAIQGKIAGRNKTSFETFVQMSGFDEIIRAANRRLIPATGGQYQLYRHEDPDAKGNVALNLDILDNYTGKKRSVNTLSGGEGFMASLSLALGLSDRVSADAGGISIDTLFIDEGFGTLDEGTLSDALQMLNQLTDSNKLIGIISHRTELKEVIDKKIVISKSEKGSNIEIRDYF